MEPCPRIDGDPEPQNGGPLSRPLGVPMHGIHTCKSYWVSVVSTKALSGLRAHNSSRLSLEIGYILKECLIEQH